MNGITVTTQLGLNDYLKVCYCLTYRTLCCRGSFDNEWNSFVRKIA